MNLNPSHQQESPRKGAGGGGLVRGLSRTLSSKRLGCGSGSGGGNGKLLSPMGGKILRRSSSFFLSPRNAKSPSSRSLFGSKRHLKVESDSEYDDDDDDDRETYDDDDDDEEYYDASTSPSRDRRSSMKTMKQRSSMGSTSFRNLTDSFRISKLLSPTSGGSNSSYTMKELEDYDDVDFDRLEQELKSRKSIEKRDQTLLLLCKELGMMDE